MFKYIWDNKFVKVVSQFYTFNENVNMLYVMFHMLVTKD